jgi:predicted nucleotidyltransferase
VEDRVMDLKTEVPLILKRHPAVKGVRLTGSRERGDATKWSDWDFLVETDNFETVADALPGLIAELGSLSYLWDPLSEHDIFMMILKGPVKVDIIFDRPHRPVPPWTVSRDNLGKIHNHFWDWIFWIAGKALNGKVVLVKRELRKMHIHLLAPLGCRISPASVEEAVNSYTTAFRAQEKCLNLKINRTLEKEVIKGLREMGFRV